MAARLGGVGEYSWGGYAGALFLVSPRDALFAIFMVQTPEYMDYLRQIFRNLVYAALV
jgi:CubicO group peptidase (beta-lactamase class C family)